MSAPGPNPVVISAQQSDVPYSITSSTKPRPVPLRVRCAVVPSQSGQQSGGGQVLLQLSDPSSFIKSGSVFLKARITLSFTPNGNTIVTWGNLSRSADSIISRLVISSGPQLEVISNYNSYSGLLITHCSNNQFCQFDNRMLQAGYKSAANLAGPAASTGFLDVAGGGGVNTQSVDVCIPLYSNLFNSDMAFPLALLSQPLMIQLDLATVGQAFYISGAGGAVNDALYHVDNVQLCYDAISPEPSFIQTLKAQLAQTGKMWSMPFTSCLSVQAQANAGTVTLNQGLGLSSLKAYVILMQENPSLVGSLKGSTRNGLANLRCFIDGQQTSSLVQDTVASQFAQLQKCFGLLGDVSRTTAAPGIVSTYNNDYSHQDVTGVTYSTLYYAAGEGFMRITDSGFALNGSPVVQFQSILDGLTGPVTVTQFFFHDLQLAIDMNGQCSIIR